ncbi:hypothetical protein F5879DRAFT_943867 [Lentinula edodes]|nr:hypothetical protein F5879DRAFT_943867 [Lentinula edodes]
MHLHILFKAVMLSVRVGHCYCTQLQKAREQQSDIRRCCVCQWIHFDNFKSIHEAPTPTVVSWRILFFHQT